MYFTALDPRTGPIARNFREHTEQKPAEIIPTNAAIGWSVQSNANNATGIETARHEYTGMLMVPFDKNRKKSLTIKTKNMKPILSILLICFFIPAVSQNTRLNGYAVYAFDDKFDSYYSGTDYYEGKFKAGLQWGIGLEFLPQVVQGIELLYLNQQTTAPTRYWAPGQITEKTTNFDVGFNWIMLAGNRYIQKPGSKVEGFGGAMVGAVIINVENPDNGSDNSATKFAWGLKLGANIWASEKMAIKLQGQLMSAVQGAGGGLYFGTGGAGAGVSTYSSMLQFGLGGGLSFKLGGAKAK
jgi:hypothetical protein